MFGLLFWVSIGDVGITMNFGANLGDWWKPAESSGTENRTEQSRAEQSRAEQSRAENQFPLHPGDVISFREERFC